MDHNNTDQSLQFFEEMENRIMTGNNREQIPIDDDRTLSPPNGNADQQRPTTSHSQLQRHSESNDSGSGDTTPASAQFSKKKSVSVSTGSSIGSKKIFDTQKKVVITPGPIPFNESTNSSENRRTPRVNDVVQIDNDRESVHQESRQDVNQSNISSPTYPGRSYHIADESTPMAILSVNSTTIKRVRETNLNVPNFKTQGLPTINEHPLYHSTPFTKPLEFNDKSTRRHKTGLTGPNGRDKVEDRLIEQLRDLVIQLDYAQDIHKRLQKEVFDKQHRKLDKAWEKLRQKEEEFNERKCAENARIADLRTALARDKQSNSAKQKDEKIKQLETQLVKLQSKDVLTTQRLSELRTNISNLEGETKSQKELLERNRKTITQQSEQLTKAQSLNASLRVKMSTYEKKISELEKSLVEKERMAAKPLTPVALRPSRGPSLLNNSGNPSTYGGRQQQQMFMPSFEQPHPQTRTVRWSSPVAAPLNGMPVPVLMNTYKNNCNRNHLTINGFSGEDSEKMDHIKYEMKGLDKVHTFQNAHRTATTIFTVQNCDCTNYKYGNNDFRWLSRPNPIHKIQVYYYDTAQAYEVLTPAGAVIKFFVAERQLEIDWPVNGRTIIFSNGTRYETFQPAGPESFYVESYEKDQTRKTFKAKRWRGDGPAEEFTPNEQRMNERKADPSYWSYSLITEGKLQIVAQDFKLILLDSDRSPDGTPTIQCKLAFVLAGYDIWLCSHNVFRVKHVIDKRHDGMSIKRVCFAYNECYHLQK